MNLQLKYHQDGRDAQCEYLIGKIDSKTVLIFIQTSQSIPSITNSIEVLFSLVLNSELKGMNPSDIRVFEFYPQLDSLTKLKEVAFSVQPIRGWGAKLLNTKPVRWNVSTPEWHPVEAVTGDRLRAILA